MFTLGIVYALYKGKYFEGGFRMTRQDAINIIEPLKIKYYKSNLNGSEILNQFSDNELKAYIALATFAYGRSWERAIENAECHIENRAKAIKLFSTKQDDLLGATI